MKKLNVKVDIKAEELRKKLNIKDGVNGKDGKDGITPSTTEVAIEASKLSVGELKPLIPNVPLEIEKNPSSVRNSLELLQGNERLDYKAIRGIDDYDEVARLAREPKVEKIYQGGSGAKSFIQLNDVPNSYSGQSGKYPRVKTDETGLEFGTLDLSGYVPTSRTLTINGTTYDLLANRSWTVGTVTGATDSTLTITGTTLGINLGNANTWTAKQSFRLTTTQASFGYDANNLMDITVNSTGSTIFSAKNNTSTANYLWFRTQTMIANEYLQLGIGANGSIARLKHSTGNATSYIDFINNNGRININGCDITSPFFVGSQYLPDAWLGASTSSGNVNSIRTSVSGTGASQTIIFYTQTYASNVVGPKLQISGQGLDLCVKDQSGSWPVQISKIIFSAGYSTGKISIGDFGTSTPASATARLEVTDTTEQFRVRYDASNYYKTTVGSTGSVTFDAVGTGAKFIFSDAVEATTVKATTAGGYISSDGSTGFTGTGAYTNFTIKDGIITNAS